MTQKTTKPKSTNWTASHDEFCLVNKVTPASKLFWQWLVYHGEEREQEPDIEKEFNYWVAKKRGKPYDPKTLKHAIKQLSECRVIDIARKYTWCVYKIFLRPVAWLRPRKKNRNSDEIPTFGALNVCAAEQGVNNNNNSYNLTLTNEERRQLEIIQLCEKYGYKDVPHALFACSVAQIRQELEKFSPDQYEELERQHSILHTCAEHGIYFNPSVKNTERLYFYDLEAEIMPALKYFIKKGGHETDSKCQPIIRHPNGWLIRCLEERWYEEQSFGLTAFIHAMTGFLPTEIPLEEEVFKGG